MDERQQRDVARGLQQGKTEAWQSLYEAYARPLWGWIARLMGGDSADVADVVQETFLAAARSARNYDPARGSLWLWLCGIGRNHVSLHYRKQKRHDRLRDSGDGAVEGQRIIRWLENRPSAPEEALAAEELAVSVRAVLTELSAEYGALLIAKYCDGATAEEIAEEQRCSSGAVRSKLARARRAFRRAFQRNKTRSLDSRSGARHDS